MSFGSFLFGNKPKNTQLSKYGPGVQSLVDQNLMRGLGGMAQGQFDFAPIEQQARTNFNTNTIPSLAERFTAMGPGAQRSSAFQGALGSAGAGLEESLASMKQNYGLQQQGLLQHLLGLGQKENIYQPEQQGLLGSLGGGLAQGAGQFGGSMALMNLLKLGMFL